MRYQLSIGAAAVSAVLSLMMVTSQADGASTAAPTTSSAAVDGTDIKAPPAARANPSARSAATPYLKIDIPAIGVSAQTYESRLSASKVMAIPSAVNQVNWLNVSSKFADQSGSMVLAGHVSDRSDNPGVFFNLKNLQQGAIISLTKNGIVRRYEMVQRRVVTRDSPLPATTFDNKGIHSIRLVTCTNKIIRSNGSFHYKDNLVIVGRLIR